MSVWSWLNNAVRGYPITKAWGDERSNAIAQLAKDIYESPSNDNDGLANLAYPIQKLVPVAEGLVVSAGPTGVEISFATAFASVDDYRVYLTWQGDPGSGSGDLYPVKSLDKVMICNAGSATGIKIAYEIKRRTV